MSEELFGDFARIAAMEKSIREFSGEGVIYEDVYVVVKCENGKVFMSGKPIREPFIYREASR